MDLKTLIQNFPTKSGVYLMKDTKKQVIYIGKAKNLKSRVRSYFSSEKTFKNRFLTPRIHHIDYILTDTESSAYLLEARLIKKHKPRYNVRLKDDKSYPYIRCSIKEDFPRFYMERRVQKKGSLYFGPYTEAFFVRRMIRFLNEQFQIRDCSNAFMKSRLKPCLTYHIGHCPAPCVKKIQPSEYLSQVKKALSFLQGKNQKKLLSHLKKNIKKLALQERFEEAKLLRDRMQAIEFCSRKATALKSSNQNMDVWAVYSEYPKGFLFQALHIREGALIGENFHFLPKESLIFAEHRTSKAVTTPQKDFQKGLPKDMVLSFLLQYYIDNVIPDLILLPPLSISGTEELSKLKGSLVKIRAPKTVAEKELALRAFKKLKGILKSKIPNRPFCKRA